MNDNMYGGYGRDKAYNRRGGVQALLMLLAVAVISAAAGAGGAYLVLESYEPPVYENTQIPEDAPVPIVTADVSGKNGDLTLVVKKAADSVVEVYTESMQVSYFGQFITEGAGSGIVYSEDGYILTNNHVIEGARSIWVRTNDGERHEAVVVGSDSQTDIAVLKIDAEGLRPVSFANSDEIQVGEVAVAIGNPLGTLGGSVTSGIISAKDREITLDNRTMTLLQTSAAVNPGNSGGGLFNGDGDLIGIINAKSSGTSDGTGIEGLGFAIPSNMVKLVAADILAEGYVRGRPHIGVTIREITDLRTAALFNLDRLGVYVLEVTEDNNLAPYDLIIEVDGEEVSTSAQISAIVERHTAGDVLKMVVVRDGKEINVDVPLAEKVPEYIKERIKAA